MTRLAIPAEAFSHGDHRRYNRGCRCTPCTRAATANARKNRYLRETGRGALTSPTQAATHINKLRSAGMTDTAIQKAANLSPDVMYRILRSERPIRRATERRILAVVAPPQPIGRNGTRIDGTGTRRRVQTLAAQGWPAGELSRRLGKTKQHVLYLQGSTTPVRLWVAVEIRTLYNQLRDLEPEDNGVSAHHAQQSRNRAAANGWPNAGYWDDDDLDNPDFQPAIEVEAKRPEIIVENASWLFECGLDREQTAERLGITRRHLERTLREVPLQGAAA